MIIEAGELLFRGYLFQNKIEERVNNNIFKTVVLQTDRALPLQWEIVHTSIILSITARLLSQVVSTEKILPS